MVRGAFERIGVSASPAGALTRLVTHRGFLPQGPPTSPAVLDIVFDPIDAAFCQLAKEKDAVYSRYMDDLAFSGRSQLEKLSKDVVRRLRQFGYGTNPDKRRVWGPSDVHTITKIVLNTTSLNPTREYMSAIVSSLRQLKKGDCPLSRRQLKGMVSWVSMLNPTLGASLGAQLGRAGL